MVAAHIIAECRKYTRVQGLALTKLTIFTVVSKMYFKLSGIPLAGRVSQWMLQCTQVASGAIPLPVHYVSLSWLLRHQYRYQPILTPKVHLMKLSSTLKKFSPVVLVSSGLQKRMSSLSDPP